jgi:hypothetical protein
MLDARGGCFFFGLLRFLGVKLRKVKVKYCDYVVTKKDKLLEKQRVSGGGIPPTHPTI